MTRLNTILLALGISSITLAQGSDLTSTWSENPASSSEELFSHSELWNRVTQNSYTTPKNIEGISTSEVLSLGPLIAAEAVSSFLRLRIKDIANRSPWKDMDIVRRSKATFDTNVISDIRPFEKKLLHPEGVCAKGIWKMNHQQPDHHPKYKGLFENGIRLPVIGRLSSGTSDSTLADKRANGGRIFGFALKIFSSSDPERPAETRNIFTLDQKGFDRSDRDRFFHLDKVYSPNTLFRPRVYFTNVAPAESLLGTTLARFFNLFDIPDFVRPLKALGRIDQNGNRVGEPQVPFEIRFYTNEKKTKRVPRPPHDFREEILQVENFEFEVRAVVYKDPVDPFGYYEANDLRERKKKRKEYVLGSVSFDSPTLSDFCDFELHFHHHANEE